MKDVQDRELRDLARQQEIPGTVRYAVFAMYAGGVQVVARGIWAFSIGSDGIRSPGSAVIAVVGTVLTAALWWLTAATCRRGRGGGRIFATAFFGINTLGLSTMLPSITTVRHDKLGFYSAEWLLGLAAVILLWNRRSTLYFQTAVAQPSRNGPTPGR